MRTVIVENDRLLNIKYGRLVIVFLLLTGDTIIRVNIIMCSLGSDATLNEFYGQSATVL